MKLNRGYDAAGKVTVAPQLVFNTPGWDDQQLKDIGHGNVWVQQAAVDHSPPVLTADRYRAVAEGVRWTG